MKDKINSILSEAKNKIAEAANEGELQSVKSSYIGKQGSLSLLMKEMPKLDVSLRPEMGKLLNQAKKQVTELIDEKRVELKLKASEVSSDFDCSVPGILPSGGCVMTSMMHSVPWDLRCLKKMRSQVRCTPLIN